MAKITIEAEDVGDLIATCRALISADFVEAAPAADANTHVAYVEGMPALEKPKGRGRPKKDAEPTPVEQASDAQKAQAVEASQQLAAENPASGSPAQTDAGDQSLAAALMGEDEPAVDGPMVMKAMQDHIAKHDADKTLALLEKHAGAKSFKQIPADKYAAVYAALQAEL